MENTIKAPQTGRRLDSDLRAICSVLEVASDHDNEVLYIHNNQIALEDADNLFTIAQLR